MGQEILYCNKRAPCPEVGRPAVLKFAIRQMKDWNNNPIFPSGIVDNVYVRQDDPNADFRLHEFVIFQTKP